MSNFSIDAVHVENIKKLPILGDDDAPQENLRLWVSPKSGLSCYYAPFEYVNTEAKLILVGITPGRTQMNRALNAARSAFNNDTSIEEAVKAVKREGSFSGTMRPNIVNTLNRLGYQRKLGIACASELWTIQNHLIQFCSLLKFPVFMNGKDYNGNPKAHKDEYLKQMLNEHFVKDMAKLPNDAMLVPLGDTVLEVVGWLKDRGLISQDIMRFEGQFVAPPHPSGANAESIALLLEPTYPAELAYAEQMYLDYLAREPWKKKNGKPQPKAKYKSARASRWNSMLFVRRAYDIQ